jgi:hypothetical protein
MNRCPASKHFPAIHRHSAFTAGAVTSARRIREYAAAPQNLQQVFSCRGLHILFLR